MTPQNYLYVRDISLSKQRPKVFEGNITTLDGLKGALRSSQNNRFLSTFLSGSTFFSSKLLHFLTNYSFHSGLNVYLIIFFGKKYEAIKIKGTKGTNFSYFANEKFF